MKLNPLHLTALTLSVVNAVAGIVLLMLSGWFIAACALAGLSTSAIVFNYVMPATGIRLFALIRIASGYGEKAVGHHSLLERLHQLRRHWFARIMSQRHTNSLRAEQAEHLNQTVEDSANRWLTVIHPNSANLVVILLTSALLVKLNLYAVSYWAALLGLNLLCLLLLTLSHQRLEQQRSEQQSHYRTQLEHHFTNAPLWFLTATLQQGIAIKHAASHWLQVKAKQRQLDSYADALLVLASGLTLVLLLTYLAPTNYGSALLMLPVILLLAMPDWLSASYRSIRQAIAARRSKQQLATLLPAEAPQALEPSKPLEQVDTTVTALQLVDYGWQYSQEGQTLRASSPINALFNGAELVWLKGSSGSGKSSLLMALAGLLTHQGVASINGQSLAKRSLKLRQKQLHYVEQFPYVLSASVKSNLLLAQPDADESRLQQALEFAGLEQLAVDLEQWIGESGRELSGGEIKRLGLARAWLFDAPIWLLDEPFEGLDSERQQRLIGRLEQLSQQKLIIVASHLWPQGITPTQQLNLDTTA